MDSNQVQEAPTDPAASGHDGTGVVPAQSDYAATLPVKDLPCPTCEGGTTMMTTPYIYALGRIEARFPRLSVEKEFAQIVGRGETNGKTDQQVFHSVLSQPENRFLVRQMCWVFSVQGLETYLVQPRNPADYDLLVGAIRPRYNPGDIDLVVGVQGPIAPPEMCNGLMLPIVGFDQIYSFTRDALIRAIPRPENADADKYGAAAEEVFDRIMQMTDNVGATDEHRALNYLPVRYDAIYTRAAEEFDREFALTGVYTQLSALSTTRKIVEVIFAYTNRNTDFVKKFCVRVDVTEEFPFLFSKLAPYFDRY